MQNLIDVSLRQIIVRAGEFNEAICESFLSDVGGREKLMSFGFKYVNKKLRAFRRDLLRQSFNWFFFFC